MKRALLLLLTLSPLAEAKMQYLRCQFGAGDSYRTIKGNYDRAQKKSGTLLVEKYFKGKVTITDVVNPRDIAVRTEEGRDLIVSEFMHQIKLTLPKDGSEEAEVDLETLNDNLAHGPGTCTFKDEDADRLEGRELCYANQNTCGFWKRFPKPEEKEKFLAEARENDRQKPAVAKRKVVWCTGYDTPTQTQFTIRGSANTEAFTVGTFVVEAKTEGRKSTEYRKYKREDLEMAYDERSRGLFIQTNESDKLRIFQSASGEFTASIRGETDGMSQSFSGPLKCELQSASPDWLASHEQCLRHYLGCAAFQAVNRDKPGPDDFKNLVEMHKQATESARRRVNKR